MRLVPVCLRLIALLFTLTLAQAQAPEPRTALVVGNADYSFGALSGTLTGNVLIVNWGSSTPVVYALVEDGSLTGLWDAGLGEETLTPEQ